MARSSRSKGDHPHEATREALPGKLRPAFNVFNVFAVFMVFVGFIVLMLPVIPCDAYCDFQQLQLQGLHSSTLIESVLARASMPRQVAHSRTSKCGGDRAVAGSGPVAGFGFGV